MEMIGIAGGCDVVLGDCIELLDALPDESVDLALTDPPYGIGYSSRRRKDGSFSRQIANDESLNVVARSSRRLYRVLKPDSALYLFASPRRQDAVAVILERAGFRVKNRIVWDKGIHTTGDCRGAFGYRYEILFLAAKGRPLIRGKRHSDVWRFPRVVSQRMAHQNEKPVPLLVQAVESFSDPGALVLDPFMGSGSTGEACAETGRAFLGCELDPRYFGPACERLRGAFGVTDRP